ncbi:hypothetical protein [Mesorhizobium sp. STM 4661]|uniref:hypothetical protein n=1 Tax=Mesorhizobium sp. STM 4661 TaxID=1297570 RepID=UPI0002BF90BB|nr:hypothetical protein [Mesorhizobium sp. STM 4661]CCV16351.1 conserved hypothetical protein [Mesorhizobium sp. STM 4661]
MPYTIDGETVSFTVPEDIAATAVASQTEARTTCEYIVNLRFWLCCRDSVDIEAENDTEAIATARRVAAKMMQSASFPASIDVEDRREGLISYIDRVDGDDRAEIADGLDFEGDRRLRPNAFVEKVAAFYIDDTAEPDELRRILKDLIKQARMVRTPFSRRLL